MNISSLPIKSIYRYKPFDKLHSTPSFKSGNIEEQNKIKCNTIDVAEFSYSQKSAHVLFHKDNGGTIVFGYYPENYKKLIEQEFVAYQPERIGKFGNKKRIIPARPAHYENTYALLPHYHIDKLYSSGKGSGTAAIKNIVAKSVQDAQTKGRVTVDATCIDGKTSPAGFYYKLGFRFVQDDLNSICEDWLANGGNREQAPFLSGMMYLPQENIKHCLNYK